MLNVLSHNQQCNARRIDDEKGSILTLFSVLLYTVQTLLALVALYLRVRMIMASSVNERYHHQHNKYENSFPGIHTAKCRHEQKPNRSKQTHEIPQKYSENISVERYWFIQILI